jgi:hypothetical protein
MKEQSDQLDKFIGFDDEQQSKIEKYIEDYGITFKLVAVDDSGEVLLQSTSSKSFDDLAGFIDTLDDEFNKLALTSYEEDYDE